MHRCRLPLFLLFSLAYLTACSAPDPEPEASVEPDRQDTASTEAAAERVVVYQIMTRLFGNTETTNRPWGTLEDNGVGRFADITDAALEGIAELGTTHIWLTGVIQHAVIRDYTDDDIPLDDPDVVKGRAGSPFAITDYYNAHPDLAEDPARRLEAFRELVDRIHGHDMAVLIDLVPNHVARAYHGSSRPEGVARFGENDDDSVAWARDNHFYYIPGECFRLPEWPEDYQPLDGEAHPLADGEFEECPARWTGNDVARAQPELDDWFETVKLNYGVTPDGEHAFDHLPDDYAGKGPSAHQAFWEGRDVPDTWVRMRDIVRFWLDQGVDGFRIDMAQMVPVEFWSYLNSDVLARHPDALLIAEHYVPETYRDYIDRGLITAVYDKVDFYDSLKPLMQDGGNATDVIAAHRRHADIDRHMLRFLENHDEHRIASPDFAGDARRGKPAMLVTAGMGRGPVMLYFGQEVGEPAAEDAGFGQAGRTTIFDYWGVPAHQRWMNDGAFDGGALTDAEHSLRDFYIRLMDLVTSMPAMAGEQAEIHPARIHPGDRNGADDDGVLGWLRWSGDQQLLLVANLYQYDLSSVELTVPAESIDAWGLADGDFRLVDRLNPGREATLAVHDGIGRVVLDVGELAAMIFERVE